MPNYRQEVFNVLLAELLQEQGIISAPEEIFRLESRQRGMPDVIVYFNGLRTAIEGEIGYRKAAYEYAFQSAKNRVDQGIAHIGVGIVYPEELRKMEFSELKTALANCLLDIAVISESSTTDFVKGNIDDLQNVLRRTFDQLVKEDIVTEAVIKIDTSVEKFAGVVAPKKGVIDRIRKILGIWKLPKEKPNEANLKVAKISGLVLINAMIFQEILTNSENIPTLSKVRNQPDVLNELVKNWDFIMKNIDYYSIFHIARNILLELTSGLLVTDVLKDLSNTALEIVGKGAALRHDLMGRIYHRLLVDAKYLGTYYTSIPASVLLLKLALRADHWTINWNDLDEVQNLHISDLSCGTGTLLMAAADALTDNYIRTTAAVGEEIDVHTLQKILVEDILYGYDVLPSALHLTASTLSLRTIDVPFKKMNLYCLPLGGKDHQLGSIEFLNTSTLEIPFDLFGAQITTETERKITTAPLPKLDLCVMNPPFTRSVGGNLLFGSAPDDVRTKMQKKLKKLLQRPDVHASATAGLGAIFVAIGDLYLKKGGRMALVLPKAVLSGETWKKTRQLLLKKYELEYIVVSHDPQKWNFSESTSLSEVLLVAKKISENSVNHNHQIESTPVAIVNLWENPTTSFDALAIARATIEETPADLIEGQGASNIVLGKHKVGEITTMSWKQLTENFNWAFPCNFAQADLTRVIYHLLNRRIWLPGYGIQDEIDLCPLGDVGVLGPDARDVYDCFDLSQSKTPYPSFWGHDAKLIYTIGQQPNMYLNPLLKARQGRHLRKVEDIWPRAGDVLIGARMRLNTQKLAAVKLSEPVLSNVWWSFSFNESFQNKVYGKALALWLNSTLGFVLLITNRIDTEGPWIKLNKPPLTTLPILDPRSLSSSQLDILSSAYDQLRDQSLQSFPQMAVDPVRVEIDNAIQNALNLPDISIVRKLLAQEPIISAKRINHN